MPVPNACKTPAPSFNRAGKLRLRLRGGRLLPQPPEQFQREAALKPDFFGGVQILSIQILKAGLGT